MVDAGISRRASTVTVMAYKQPKFGPIFAKQHFDRGGQLPAGGQAPKRVGVNRDALVESQLESRDSRNSEPKLGTGLPVDLVRDQVAAMQGPAGYTQAKPVGQRLFVHQEQQFALRFFQALCDAQVGRQGLCLAKRGDSTYYEKRFHS